MAGVAVRCSLVPLALAGCAPPGAAPLGGEPVGVSRAALGCAESPVAVDPAQVTASGSYGSSTPELAFDGSTVTVWNAGGPPSQWLEVNLGASVPVTRIRMLVAQSPPGATSHTVSVAADGAPQRNVAVVAGETAEGQWLEVPILHRVQTLRITTTTSPSWVAWAEIELFEDATIAPEYFGYYCSGCSWVGSGDYTAATADHANLVWIADSPVANVTARIEQAAALGMRSVVSLSSVFFVGASLGPDYATGWSLYADALEPFADSIAAFYPMDEPDLQGFDDATLGTAIAAIKARFPDIPVGVIYSPLTVGNGNHPGLASYDWVGIDCYSAGAYNCQGTPFEDAHYALRALLDTSRQRMMLVPQAGLPVGTPDTAADALALEIDRYVSLAHRDLAVVAIVPFLYQSFNDGSANWNGLEAYPALRAKFANVGVTLGAEHAAATAPCEAGNDAGVGGGGAGGSGGSAGVGGAGAGTGVGGIGPDGGVGAGGSTLAPAASPDGSGCSCRLTSARGSSVATWYTAFLLAGVARLRRRSRRRRPARRPGV